ncbi:hypothetical protein NQ317_000088 [Molorchus minor]|uniref:Uncharacterized protein n=1 Tax=Molorchus minor TaxID=1323400 RepID=A0ABQ9IXL6_9CUCU|nr:hypothetical protein NQ317_000088 [Molorchus minor]
MLPGPKSLPLHRTPERICDDGKLLAFKRESEQLKFNAIWEIKKMVTRILSCLQLISIGFHLRNISGAKDFENHPLKFIIVVCATAQTPY